MMGIVIVIVIVIVMVVVIVVGVVEVFVHADSELLLTRIETKNARVCLVSLI